MFSKSEKFSENYCASIVEVSELHPIQGADRLLRTVLNGYDVLVSVDTKIGDKLLFFQPGCQLSEEFCSKNNLFSDSERNLNKDKKGFFSNKRLVKTLKLRGCPSLGFAIPIEQAIQYFLGTNGSIDFSHFPEDMKFDTVKGNLLVQKYVSKIDIESSDEYKYDKNKKHSKIRKKKNKIIPEQWEFHYNTSMLNESIRFIKLDDVITITKKIHGTSFISGKILTQKKTFWHKIKSFFLKKNFYTPVYENIYSSRNVIRRSGDDEKMMDIYGHVNKLISPNIVDGMVVYGEAYGYMPGCFEKFIQKGYDYGAKPGCFKVMPYRVVEVDKDNNRKEWDTERVVEWTKALLGSVPELSEIVEPMEILFKGSLLDLYPEIRNSFQERLGALPGDSSDEARQTLEDEARQAILANMKVDERFNAEGIDETCKAEKVPEEGIVVRIVNDLIPRAFKLKWQRFYKREIDELEAEG